MKKLKVFLLTLTFVLIPTIVFATDTTEIESEFPVGMAIFMELFVTIHMSIFVLFPLSKIISKENSATKVFWTLFIIRAVILLFFDLFVTPMIAIVDFFAVFVGAFLIVPSALLISNKKGTKNTVRKSSIKIVKTPNVNNIDNISNINNIYNSEVANVTNDTSPIVSIDPEYLKSDEELLRNIITKEIENQDEDAKVLTTNELNSSKNIIILIFGLLTFFFTIMYFFNYRIEICFTGEIFAIIWFIFKIKKYDIVSAIARYAKKNPNSEIFQIVTDVKDRKKYGTFPDNVKIVSVIAVAIIAPIIMFSEPKLIYTKCDGGYSVYRYTRSFSNKYDEVIIPNEHKGKPVVKIGKNAFATTQVKSVELPESIKIIEERAFYDCSNLTEINFPSSLDRIDNYAFGLCSSLYSIYVPKETEISVIAFFGIQPKVNYY